jgi:cyclic beta-1,2-glucan synthetase
MYRAGLESILGFQLRADRLRLEPCIPRWWREFEITHRRGDTVYRIIVENPTAVSRGVASVELDGKMLPEGEIQLVDDRAVHNVRITLGEVPVKEVVPQPGTARFQRVT